MQQRTIQCPVMLTGIGLHSGKNVTLNLLPAAVNTGVVFLRTDLTHPEPISANYQAVTDTMLSSKLTNHANQHVGTVEHLMSAIAALGIDNLQIEVSAAEIPIMDGSAIAFIEPLLQAGILEQDMPKQFVQVLREVKVSDGDKWAKIVPYHGFSLDFEIAFDHPVFAAKNQRLHIDFGKQQFIKDIATARTFGFLKDIDQLKSKQLALGGSIENAIVLSDTQVLNPDGLRFEDEFVRHKILDAVGDLYLAGHQLLGAFSAYKSGHALNNQLLKALFADQNNFKIVTSYNVEGLGIIYEN